MAVMTMKSEDYKALPVYLKEYANFMKVVRGKSEKTSTKSARNMV